MVSVGVILNGVTGRMGRSQHLERSILAIRADGGLQLPSGDAIWPEPILVGRDERKLSELARSHGLSKWTTDLDSCLADPAYSIYFDAQATGARATTVRSAISAGKHVYTEKPVTSASVTTIELARLAAAQRVRTGVVADKLFLPGVRQLRSLIRTGALGRILSVKVDFGYWVFDGGFVSGQRPSWNHRLEDGGGIVTDMYVHWAYLLECLVGYPLSVVTHAVTDINERRDEGGQMYRCTADDSAFGMCLLPGGVVAQINSSWTARVYRSDLLQLQVDGTGGSAVATAHDCRYQSIATTPRAVWNPDEGGATDYCAGWQLVPAREPSCHVFKAEWEMFLRHVVVGTPFPYDFAFGARGNQLAEAALRSNSSRQWVEVDRFVS